MPEPRPRSPGIGVRTSARILFEDGDRLLGSSGGSGRQSRASSLPLPPTLRRNSSSIVGRDPTATGQPDRTIAASTPSSSSSKPASNDNLASRSKYGSSVSTGS